MTDEEIAGYVQENIAELRHARGLARERVKDVETLAGLVRDALARIPMASWDANPWTDEATSRERAVMSVRDNAVLLADAIAAAIDLGTAAAAKYSLGSPGKFRIKLCHRYYGVRLDEPLEGEALEDAARAMALRFQAEIERQLEQGK